MSQNYISKRNPQERKEHTGYPSLKPHLEKVLIVVKTAPTPSIGHRETVCTAGITESGKWIRLYPLPYRYLDYYSRFSKYQWIEIEIEKRPQERDFRIDSYQPNFNKISLGEKLPAEKWAKRKGVVLPTISKNLEEIMERYKAEKISLGIFKPKKIKNFKIEVGEKDWSKKHQVVLGQGVLFETQPKPLEKMPYKFSYSFDCNNENCKGHELEIFDWELYELYRNMKEKYSFSMDVVLEKVKNKWLYEMWRDDKDSYLIVGTIYPKPSFIVLGVFWPPKVK